MPVILLITYPPFLIQDIQVLQLLLRGLVNPVSFFQFLDLLPQRWLLLSGIFHGSLLIAGRHCGWIAYDDCRTYHIEYSLF